MLLPLKPGDTVALVDLSKEKTKYSYKSFQTCNYLEKQGFSYYDTKRDIDTISYYYFSPNHQLVSVSIMYDFNEAWIAYLK